MSPFVVDSLLLATQPDANTKMHASIKHVFFKHTKPTVRRRAGQRFGMEARVFQSPGDAETLRGKRDRAIIAKAGSSIPIVLLTPAVDPAARTAELKISHWISKPFEASTLTDLLAENVLPRKRHKPCCE
jgi:hypothetical protein